MPSSAQVGLHLHADGEFLELTAPLFEHCQLIEVTAETLWQTTAEGLADNDFHALFLSLKDRLDVPFVAHGVELSIGSVEDDQPRLRRHTEQWLRQLAADQGRFEFAWFTEHLGFSLLDDLYAALPLPLPLTTGAVRACRARLSRLRGVFPAVGFENNVSYAPLEPIEGEPAFFNAVCGDDLHLLLDLHNVYTQCLNEGVDPEGYLAGIDLTRVIEIHLSGGAPSEPEWLSSGRVYRLDSHDDAVPEEVWRLFELVLPRCANLKGVVLERMPGTLTQGDVPDLADELQRARRLVSQARLDPGAETPTPRATSSLLGRVPLVDLERALIELACAADPATRLTELRRELPGALEHVRSDKLELVAILVRKLRLERLLQGSAEAGYWFQNEPETFLEAFTAYHQAVRPSALFPDGEARLFEEWLERGAR